MPELFAPATQYRSCTRSPVWHASKLIGKRRVIKEHHHSHGPPTEKPLVFADLSVPFHCAKLTRALSSISFSNEVVTTACPNKSSSPPTTLFEPLQSNSLKTRTGKRGTSSSLRSVSVSYEEGRQEDSSWVADFAATYFWREALVPLALSTSGERSPRLIQAAGCFIQLLASIRRR